MTFDADGPQEVEEPSVLEKGTALLLPRVC